MAIYRTVYPLQSETFISSQVTVLRKFKPIIWARDVVSAQHGDLQVRSLVSNVKWVARAMFTILGWVEPNVALRNLPVLLHAHFGTDAAIVLPLAKRYHIPLVVTFHGFDAQRSRVAQLTTFKPYNLVFLLREHRLYRYAARIIAVSEYLKGRLIRRGCPADKITVHYIGVDTRKFVPDATCRKPFRIVNVARHVPLKGIDTILRALRLIAEEFPALEFVQIGSGPESESLARLAQQLEIADRVTWLGQQPNDRVLATLQSSSLYVQASRRDEAGQTEAFGIALLEAQACGLPVVATNSGGMPEAIVEGGTGMLFEENDHRGLADRLRELLVDPAKAREMGEHARQMVVERFDIRAQTAILEQLYDEVLAKNRR